MQRIVIVGGGVGGTMLANLLVVRLYPEDTRRRGRTGSRGSDRLPARPEGEGSYACKPHFFFF